MKIASRPVTSGGRSDAPPTDAGVAPQGIGEPFRKPAVAALALVLLVCLCYQPVLSAGFIWDDDDYVTKNATLRQPGGLGRIWFEFAATPQYYPLVHTSYWIEYRIWGLEPAGFHLVNVLLHAGNVLLLWRLLLRLGVPGAFWAAALFAAHPVMVESVAWVTERKNVLSTLFYLFAFRCLLRAWPPEEEKPRIAGKRWAYYGGGLLLFTCALLSKTVTASLPAAFLVVRWWKRGRLTRADFLAMLPLFAAGFVLGLNTARLERVQVKAEGAEWAFTFADRVLIAGRALWFYAGKLLWPDPIIFFYPKWKIDPAAAWQWLYPLAAVAVIAAAWRFRGRWGRGPLAALLFFSGTLFPALGFFNVFPMRYSFVADHFQYLAAVGMLALFAAAAVEGLRRVAADPRTVLNVVGGIALLACVLISRTEVRTYDGLMTLWNDVIAKNPTAWVAYNNRAEVHWADDRLDEAVADMRRALELKPDNWEANFVIGRVKLKRGDLTGALAEFERYLELRPGDEFVLTFRGDCHLQMRQPEKALDDYNSVLATDPKFALALSQRGMAYEQLGDIDQAVRDVEWALRIDPKLALGYRNRAVLMERLNRLDAAVADYTTALDLDPKSVDAWNNRGVANLKLGRPDQALKDFAAALSIDPGAARVYANRAVLHFIHREFPQAWDDVRRCRAAGGHPDPAFLADLAKESGVEE